MPTPRFLTPNDVADTLAASVVQVMALIRRGDIEGIRIGGRGEWRVEADKLEEYIQRQYAAARAERESRATAELHERQG